MLRRLVAECERWLVGAALLATAVLVCTQIVLRFIGRAVPALAVSFSFTEEIARYLLVWCTLLGAAAAVRQGGHIGMQLFSPRLQANWARRLSLGGLAVMAGVFGLVAWTGIGYVAQGVRTGETSQGMGLPIAVLRLAIPVGGALVAGRCVEAAARLWRQRKP